MSITVNDLSIDQREAYNSIVGWMRSPSRPVLTLGGFAGSGKSTLVSLVAEQTNLPAFCAYTGKASSILKRKLSAAGVGTVGTQKAREDGGYSLEQRPFCGTIHSLIYRPCSCLEPQVVEVQKPCPEKNCSAELVWADGHAQCANKHECKMSAKAFEALKPRQKFIRAEKNDDGSCKFCGGKEWLRRETLDRPYGLIIVDEASMVDDNMLRDLQSYNVPILAVGDHGQLPPVGGVGSLMKAPNLCLEKIHRQAEGNPIIALSKFIRENGGLPDASEGSDVVIGRLRTIEGLIESRYEDASAERLLQMGLVCYTNRRRNGLNTMVRRARGTARSGKELPQKGEHVVCLRNMKTRNGGVPVYNGMRGVLVSDTKWKEIRNSRDQSISESEIHITGEIEFPEDGIAARQYEMLAQQFSREKTFQQPEELAREVGIHSFSMAGSLFDFGFAMTAHKMQGSQVDDLVVCAERGSYMSDEDWRRWLYTAVTRAAKKLTVLR